MGKQITPERVTTSTLVRRTAVSRTYTLGEAGRPGGPPGWVLQAAVEQLEARPAGAPPTRAALSPGGTPGTVGRPDSRGSPGPAPAAWPGPVWSRSSGGRHTVTGVDQPRTRWRVHDHPTDNRRNNVKARRCRLTFISSIMSWVKTPFSRRPS